MNAGLDAAAWGGYRLVPTLLAARLRMLANAALRAGRERRGWTVLLGVAALGLMTTGYRLADAALAVSNPSPAGLEPVAAGLCGMIAGFTAVTGITFAISACYFARDLEGLLVTPLPPRALLLTKLCVQLATGLAVGAVLGAAPLLAYAGRNGALAAVPFVGMCVLAMAAFPLAAGTVVTVVAVRLMPARRVRDAGGVLVTATVFGVTSFNLLARGPESFNRTPGLLDPSRQAGVVDSAWLPTGWAARAAVAALRGDAAAALAWGLPMITGAALLLLLVSRVLEAPYLTGFQRSQEAGRGRTRRRAARAATGRGRRPAWLVIARKDLRETLRDASQLGQLVLPLALFALYIASPTAVGVSRTADLPAWFGTVLTAGFASLFAASGMGLRGIGSEGRRLWVLRVAPIDVRSVLAAKLLAGLVVAVALGQLLFVIGALRLHLGVPEAALVSLRLTVVVGGLVGLAVGMGAIRPRLDWTDPRRSIGIGTSLSFLALGSTYLGAVFVVLALPYTGGHATNSMVALADVGVLVLTGVTAAVPLAIGAARLRAIEL